jgi:cardiolipin-specific phospholipase
MKKQTLEKCKEYEKEILRLVGIPNSEFNVSECHLSEKDYIHYVQIKKTKQTEKNVLLMAHGYMGSNIGFFKIYNTLKNDFHIYSIDVPGQGLSSSIEKTPKSINEWLNYFISNILKFCKKMGLTKFSICGHSMGAYILSHFAGLYPKMIDNIFLLSPGGVNYENFDFEMKMKRFMKTKNCLVKCIAKSVSNSIFVDKKAPMNLWYVSPFRAKFAKIVYGGKRLGLNNEEQKSFIPLYTHIYKSKPSTDMCLGYLFKEGPMSDKPLMDVFQQIHKKKNIICFYGQRDWMDHQKAKEKIDEFKLKVDIDFISNCDHQIVFQNPVEAGQKIIKTFKKWRKLKEKNPNNTNEIDLSL